MSQITKRALAASLKKLLAEKALDKITVTDLVEDCGVNRQTFYYHFRDIYDLVEWIYTSEASAALGEKKTYDTWQQGFLEIFRYAQENRAFVLRTYHSLSREHLERYLFSETYALLENVVEEQSAGRSIRSSDKAFIANFYKYGFVGLMLDWIGAGMKEDPRALVERLELVIHGSISAALDRLAH
ncbi:TetR/AcrR family transcriptional regulator [Anaerofilum sp. BX8]|uniref:TetR/AcrR family transcriptional regulator n=1 Tax=Anaerofilum hominis TaxID=2763016 RepID=A0A923KWJ2_9FIRM|nr:TetR/AcrR family transcriptional regulator [Anaerofilum hominis]MBC5581961.1 TetR/AcrR family transcriptional regulator [Anaerofilum hominis]